ncbi:MAG: hypothetical protein JO152_00500 [Mycobacteriaceae bacterium]|nr:hypothetical protein [Mycobacteriaceae bacterium]
MSGLLADNTPHNTGPDFGKASPVGLLIVVILLIGTVLLVRSMNRHLRKLPESFDSAHPGPDQAADEGTVETGGSTALRTERETPPPARGDAGTDSEIGPTGEPGG